MPDRPKLPRLQTATEREMQSEQFRKEREAAERAKSPTLFVAEEITGNYQGEELDAMRAGRPPEDRLHILEKKHDKVAERLGSVEKEVAGLAGEMKVIPSLISTMQDATKAMQQREHVKFTAQVDVEKKAAEAEIEVAKEQKIVETRVAEAHELDVLNALKAKRKRRNLYVAGAVAAVSVAKHVIEFGSQAIHWLWVHL